MIASKQQSVSNYYIVRLDPNFMERSKRVYTEIAFDLITEKQYPLQRFYYTDSDFYLIFYISKSIFSNFFDYEVQNI